MNSPKFIKIETNEVKLEYKSELKRSSSEKNEFKKPSLDSI